jgi:hypothetical protein
MKRNILFIVLIIFLLTVTVPLKAKDRDTCQVLTARDIVPYSHIEVQVRVFTSEVIDGLVIPLTWDTVTTDIICDSIQWSDWFWNNPAQFLYSGGPNLENYVDTSEQTVQIVAAWLSVPYLPARDTILATIHFTIGRISVIEPISGEEWRVGESRWIRWLSQCDWKAADSVAIDSFRSTHNYEIPPINFSYASGAKPDSVEWDTSYIVRAPEFDDSVMIEYSADAGKSWSTVIASTTNDGEYLWSPIPNTASDSCLIRITSKTENPISVLSDGYFTIKAETTGVREERKPENLPEKFVLHQNYPNPFNPSTKIEFSLSERARVRLEIYDITGRRVKRLLDEELSSGHWSIVWDGEDDRGTKVASGVYFYRLIASQFTQTRKMVIIK